jgi:hypothetical protein
MHAYTDPHGKNNKRAHNARAHAHTKSEKRERRGKNKNKQKQKNTKNRAPTSGAAWPLSSASRLPFSQYFITSHTLPSGASVQMPYTGRTWSWGLAISFSYRLRSLSMAAVSTHSVPFRLTATVMPLASHSMNSSSPKAPLGPRLRTFRLAWGMRGRRGPAGGAAAGGVLYRGPGDACQWGRVGGLFACGHVQGGRHTHKRKTSGDQPRHGRLHAQKIFVILGSWQVRRWVGDAWARRGVCMWEEEKTTEEALPVWVCVATCRAGHTHNRRPEGTNHSMEHHAHRKYS